MVAIGLPGPADGLHGRLTDSGKSDILHATGVTRITAR
jgi:hypothetical protein